MNESNSIIIEKLTINEIDEVIQLQNNNITILSKNSILEDLNNTNSIYFIAKSNNIIIGYIAANILFDHIDILSILVDKKFRKQAVASILLSNILKYANNLKINNILLEVRVSNISARKLYEKFNFKKINIRKKYYSNNLEDAIVYKLSINK